MFAHRIVAFTGPDDVRWTEVEEPPPEGGVVIDVAAAGVSFADLLQTRGGYQLKVWLPFTPGMDAAGVIRSAPPNVGLTVGQRVAVLTSYGCWQRSRLRAHARLQADAPSEEHRVGEAVPADGRSGRPVAEPGPGAPPPRRSTGT